LANTLSQSVFLFQADLLLEIISLSKFFAVTCFIHWTGWSFRICL